MENQFERLNILVQQIPKLSSKEEIFNLICKISKETENLNESELKGISHNNELYVDLIFNVFNNCYFFNNLEDVIKAPYEVRADKTKLKEQRQIIQLFLRLSFFMVSVLVPILNKETIIFLNQCLSSSIKYIYSKLLNILDMKNVLFALEDINFDFHYGFKKDISLGLNTDYLNMNLISSRILMGSLIMNKIGYWVLPDTFTNIVKKGKSPARLFQIVHFICYKISHYRDYGKLLNAKYFSKERKDALIFFLSLLEDQNIDDLLFLVNEINIDYRPDYLDKSRDHKIEMVADIKKKVQDRFERLSVFTKNASTSSWSNKVFLNTIRFLAVIESIKKANDSAWKIHTYDHFFNQWLVDMYAVVNYSEMGSNDEIVIYVEGYSDKIILENAYKKLYPEHNGFIFYDAGGKRELSKKIDAVQINDLEKISFGIFDFDEAYNDFCGLREVDKNKNIGGFGEIKGEEKDCLYRTREEGENRIFALLLPVPEFRNSIANKKFEGKSILSLELLFEDSVLRDCGNLTSREIPGTRVDSFTGDKIKFAKKTKSFEKEKFRNFEPLFERLFQLSGQKGKNNQKIL